MEKDGHWRVEKKESETNTSFLLRIKAILYSIVYAYVITCISLHFSKMNGINGTRNWNEELGLFCYYKVLPGRQFNAIQR